MGLHNSERSEAVLTSVKLPDGSVSGGLLIRQEEGLVLRLFEKVDIRKGEEVLFAGTHPFTAVDVGYRTEDGGSVTDLRVDGPFLRLLEGHHLGDGWPQLYWRHLARRCDLYGFAHPVVRFLEFLGELRTIDQLGLAQEEVRSLSAEHLATVTGQVGGALLNLRRLGAPENLVADISALYSRLVDEMRHRGDRGDYLQPPNPTAKIRFGGLQSDDWRSLQSWLDPVSSRDMRPPTRVDVV